MRLGKLIVTIFGLGATLAWADVAPRRSQVLPFNGRLLDEQARPIAGPVTLQINYFRSEAGDDRIPAPPVQFPTVPLADGVFRLTIVYSPDEVDQIFGDGSHPVYLQVTDVTHERTYLRQRYDLPAAPREPPPADPVGSIELPTAVDVEPPARVQVPLSLPERQPATTAATTSTPTAPPMTGGSSSVVSAGASSAAVPSAAAPPTSTPTAPPATGKPSAAVSAGAVPAAGSAAPLASTPTAPLTGGNSDPVALAGSAPVAVPSAAASPASTPTAPPTAGASAPDVPPVVGPLAGGSPSASADPARVGSRVAPTAAAASTPEGAVGIGNQRDSGDRLAAADASRPGQAADALRLAAGAACLASPVAGGKFLADASDRTPTCAATCSAARPQSVCVRGWTLFQGGKTFDFGNECTSAAAAPGPVVVGRLCCCLTIAEPVLLDR